MAQSDKYMADHVRSAKVWLERAEQSFNSQSDIKGELNLMLAQAEMKNLRKKKGTPVYVKYLAAAVLVVVCAIGGSFWLLSQDEATPPARSLLPVEEYVPPVMAAPPGAVVPATDAGVPPIEAAPVDVEGPAYVPAQPQAVPDTRPEAPSDTVAAVPPPPVVTPAEEMPVLTDRQMQAAVQDARHTLRSTAKEIK